MLDSNLTLSSSEVATLLQLVLKVFIIRTLCSEGQQQVRYLSILSLISLWKWDTNIKRELILCFLRGGWLEICSKQDDLAGIANRLPWSSCIYYSRNLKDACKMWLTWHAVVEGVQYRGSAELVQWTGHWNNQSTDKIQEKMLNLEIIYLWNYV